MWKTTQRYKTVIITIITIPLIRPIMCYSGSSLSVFVTYCSRLAFSCQRKKLSIWSLSLYLGNRDRRMKCSVWVSEWVSVCMCVFKPNFLHGINIFYRFHSQVCSEITAPLWAAFRKPLWSGSTCSIACVPRCSEENQSCFYLCNSRFSPLKEQLCMSTR